MASWAAGVFRFGGETAGGTRSHARVACEDPRATGKPFSVGQDRLILTCSGLGARTTVTGARVRSRGTGPRATIKKTVLEPSQLCSRSGRRGTNAVSMQRRRDSLSTNHRRNPRGNRKHTGSEKRRGHFVVPAPFFSLQNPNVVIN